MKEENVSPTWEAFCTIWWFASGDEIMRTSNKQDLLSRMYAWYLASTDKEI